MIKFENEYFKQFKYSEKQIKEYLINADKDYLLAKKSNEPNIFCRIGYDSIIKLGVALIAKNGYKTRSIPGHHIKILVKLREILKLKDEELYILNKIRKRRNFDLYEGGSEFTEKETKDFSKILSNIFKKAKI